MNDRRFLELLNLYLDAELPPDEAAGLEEEILNNPARRRVYNDYCRIHRATQVVFERFRAPAAEGATAEPGAAATTAGTALARFDGRPARRRFPIAAATGWAAGLAACAAVVVSIDAWRQAAPVVPEIVAVPVPAAAAESPIELAPQPRAAPLRTVASPLAPMLRPDPYVIQFPDRFSIGLTSAEWPLQPGSTPSLFAPATFNVPAMQESEFGLPTSLDFYQPVDSWPRQSSTPVFRGQGDAAELQPVGFEMRR